LLHVTLNRSAFWHSDLPHIAVRIVWCVWLCSTGGW